MLNKSIKWLSIGDNRNDFKFIIIYISCRLKIYFRFLFKLSLFYVILYYNYVLVFNKLFVSLITNSDMLIKDVLLQSFAYTFETICIFFWFTFTFNTFCFSLHGLVNVVYQPSTHYIYSLFMTSVQY